VPRFLKKMSKRSPTLIFMKIRAESGYYNTTGRLRFYADFRRMVLPVR
jgi:hypothetical protein